MKQAIFIIALVFGNIFYCNSQQIKSIPSKKVNKFTNGWHKFSSEGAFLDVEIKSGFLTKGNVTWFDGTTYSGLFSGNKISGSGTYSWINGERYEGRFRNNQRHGKGSMYYKDGTKYFGKWKNNKKHGKGKLYDSNDILITEGIWEQNTLLSEKN